MSVKEIIEIIAKDGGGWIFVIFAMLSIIQICPLKINPWTELGNIIKKSITKEVNDEIKTTNDRVTVVEDNIEEINVNINTLGDRGIEYEIESTRMIIIDAARELKKNGVTDGIDIEYLSQINKKCDWYEKICEEKNIPNGVATASIEYLRETYKNAIL